MAYPSKTQEDYEKLADLMGLDLLDPAPRSVLTPIHWRCIHCKRTHFRSYNKCMFAEYGCRCQSRKNLKVEDYRKLAARLGIKWVGRDIPHTAHVPTTWEGFNGELFTVSYAKLAYPQQVPLNLLYHFALRAREEIEAVRAERRERLRQKRIRSMTVPTLQQLQNGFGLSNHQQFLLRVAAGDIIASIPRRHGFNSLRDLGLLDENHKLTSIGQMELNRIKEKRIIKINKRKKKE